MKARKEPKQVELDLNQHVFCGCVNDFTTWVKHNIDSLVIFYSEFLIQTIIAGNELPPEEAFEDFCHVVHECVRDLVASKKYNATIH